ncbi:sensor domain-containing protein [Mycobacterium kansasii]|nr:sensor domain-containing protein [Mycobacterium kansasii]
MPATGMAPSASPAPAPPAPRPAPQRQPPYYPAGAGSGPSSGPSAGPGQPGPAGASAPPGRAPTPPPAAPAGQPSWAPTSGPMPASQPTPTPAFYQGGGWGGTPPGTPPPQQPPGPPAWNQGQQPSASRNRNPGPIVAAVAIVLVLVVGGVGIWLVTRPKPAPPPKPISEDRLSALLLSPSEINSVMGASNIQPGKPITSMDTSPVTLSLPDCQAALYTSQDPVYAGTGYTGISGLVSSEPGDTYDHWVNQAVVAFPSADKARSFLQSAAGKWKNCAGKTVTVTNQGKTYRWTFADVVGSPPKMTVIDTQEGADGWECQRAMSVANNVIVDINACGYQITDQGGQIADQIIAKVNKETK